MNIKDKNKKLKLEILKQYGSYDNFAKKVGYTKSYVVCVVNRHKPLTITFREAVNNALDNDYWEKDNSKFLFSCLIESSSLRSDLLLIIKRTIKDILDNINLDDELCKRVNDETYAFIKNWK